MSLLLIALVVWSGWAFVALLFAWVVFRIYEWLLNRIGRCVDDLRPEPDQDAQPPVAFVFGPPVDREIAETVVQLARGDFVRRGDG